MYLSLFLVLMLLNLFLYNHLPIWRQTFIMKNWGININSLNVVECSVFYIFCNEDPLWMKLCLNTHEGLLQYSGTWKHTVLQKWVMLHKIIHSLHLLTIANNPCTTFTAVTNHLADFFTFVPRTTCWCVCVIFLTDVVHLTFEVIMWNYIHNVV